jgi:glycosyltransferase involved in cell wall biosynthesis
LGANNYRRRFHCRTREIAAQYGDRRIKYIRQDNVGTWRLAETYNKALQLSEGQLIAILDGDDFWPNYKLERQVPLFKREDKLVSGFVIVLDDYGWSGHIVQKKP